MAKTNPKLYSLGTVRTGRPMCENSNRNRNRKVIGVKNDDITDED